MVNKKIITLLLICILLPINLFSQIKIINEKDSSVVPYAHILLDNTLYTYSKENGEFTIDNKQIYDTLKIAHISYETKLISYNDAKKYNTISLKEKSTTLDEVSITSENRKKKIKTILPERATRDFIRDKYDILLINDTAPTEGALENSDSINISRAIYIPNENKKHKTLITKIILKSVDKEIKDDPNYIPFKVNLMTYDTITKLPKEKIFAEDLAIGKKQGQTIVIDLEKEELIEFPAEGICVVVSVYSQLHYVYSGFTGPPKFDVVSLKSTSGFHEYYLYYSPRWKEQPYSQRREQVFNFGIEIEYIE